MEFAVLLFQTELKDAVSLAEKLREAIAAQPFEGVGQLTVSIGVTAYQPNETLEAWFVRADQHLYEAKLSGRNYVKGV